MRNSDGAFQGHKGDEASVAGQIYFILTSVVRYILSSHSAATPGCNSHCVGHGLNPHQHYNHPHQDHIDIGHGCHDDQNHNINILNISV